MNNKDILKAVGFVSAGVAAGSTCTYFSVKSHFKKKYADLADKEIAQVKTSYAMLRKEGPYSDPKNAVREYQKNVKDLQYAAQEATLGAAEGAVEEEIQQEADEQKANVRNIFEHELAAFDEALRGPSDTLEQRLSIKEAEKLDRRDPDAYDELTSRDPNLPFHISKDDYFDYTNEFEKLTITYYEGDNTLTDDDDKPVLDIEQLIGLSNLNRFGQASEDPNIVYIRNERLRTDFEVVRDTRDYTAVVLGLPDYSEEDKRIRRMRNDE